jgi:hypothetical protein
MANGQIKKLLEFVSMQMAAEAFLSRSEDTVSNQPRNEDILDRLVEGNDHTNIFTPVQSAQFTGQYEVVTQYRNDPLQAGEGTKQSKGSASIELSR